MAEEWMLWAGVDSFPSSLLPWLNTAGEKSGSELPVPCHPSTPAALRGAWLFWGVMSQYSFPLLSTSEIVSCLAEFDLPLEEAQLAKPTHDAMRAVYESVVHVLVEVSREELLQPVFSAIDALEFPELHDESIPAMSLLHHLTRLMTSAGVKDFGLKVPSPFIVEAAAAVCHARWPLCAGPLPGRQWLM